MVFGIAAIFWLVEISLSLREASDALVDLGFRADSFSAAAEKTFEARIPSDQPTIESDAGVDRENLIGPGDVETEARLSERKEREAAILGTGLNLCDPDGAAPLNIELTTVGAATASDWPECRKAVESVSAAIQD
jgi:hypothetical protein